MAKTRTRKKTTRTAKRTAKRTPTRKKTAKRTTRAATSRRSTITAARDKPRTKAQLYRDIAEQTDLTRQQVVQVFDVLGEMISKDLTRGTGIFNLAGLMKITRQRKPATKARKGVNPFTGEEIMIKAKPARNVVKVRPLKTLKEMV